MAYNKIRVLKLAPGETPCAAEIFTTETSLRKAVNIGGNHEYMAKCRQIEKDICVLFNKERSWSGLMPNRRIADDILCGVVYITGRNDDGTLRSLTDDEMEKYASVFHEPEAYTEDEVISANLSYTYNVQIGNISRDITPVYT